MWLISRFVKAWALGRLLRGGHRRRRARGGYLGPFPAYSTRTRGGSRVRVTGCCLPLPLALVVTTALSARTLLRR